MTWLNALANPKIPAVKKMMFELLRERYARNDDIVERLAAALQTEEDIKSFVRLMTDVFETAYLRAVNDHKEQLEKAGLAVKVVASK